jgi:hypothetical protein
MRKIQKKKVKTKKVDKKLEWLAKPTKYISTDKLDGRRKVGVDSGLFGNSKPILSLKPIKPDESVSKIEEIKKRKLEEKLRKTARTMSSIKKGI